MRNTFMLPTIFCLEDLQCSADDTDSFGYRATLYHDQACITVSFDYRKRDPDLAIGKFVSVRWKSDMHSDHGAIQVAGLTLLNGSVKKFNPKTVNPFQIVPHTWSVDRHLVNCARDLWGVSSKEMRQLLFDTVLAKAVHSVQ